MDNEKLVKAGLEHRIRKVVLAQLKIGPKGITRNGDARLEWILVCGKTEKLYRLRQNAYGIDEWLCRS